MGKSKVILSVSILKTLIISLFFSMVLGQLGGISVYPGVTIYIHDIIVACILFIGLPYVLQEKKIIQKSRYVPIVAFVVIAILSLFINSYRFDMTSTMISSLYLIRWTSYALVYIVLSAVALETAFIEWGLYMTGTAVSLLGFVQYVLYPELRNLSYLGWDPHFYRLFSTFLDPNFVGLFIVLTFLLGMQIMQKKQGTLIWFFQGINLIALYLTYSRSSYLAFVVAILCYIIGKKKYLLLGGLVLFMFLLIIIPKPGGNTLLLTRMDSTNARICNWIESIALIQKSWFIGYGFNTLRYVRAQQLPSTSQIVSKAGAGLDSSILFILATTGFVGFVSYGWMMQRIIRPFVFSKRFVTIRVLFINIIGALLVHSMFVNSLFYPWIMLWFWLLLAGYENLGRKSTD